MRLSPEEYQGNAKIRRALAENMLVCAAEEEEAGRIDLAALDRKIASKLMNDAEALEEKATRALLDVSLRFAERRHNLRKGR